MGDWGARGRGKDTCVHGLAARGKMQGVAGRRQQPAAVSTAKERHVGSHDHAWDSVAWYGVAWRGMSAACHEVAWHVFMA